MEAETEGPALNISVIKKAANLETVCCMKQKNGKEVAEEGQKILDVDFTFSLFCPKFPQAGKCKAVSLIILRKASLTKRNVLNNS